MPSLQKVFDAILTARSDNNVSFTDLQRILRRLGFAVRRKGSHFIYTHDRIAEIINIQAGNAGKAKPYQVKQIRGIITHYGLTIEGMSE